MSNCITQVRGFALRPESASDSGRGGNSLFTAGSEAVGLMLYDGVFANFEGVGGNVLKKGMEANFNPLLVLF